MPDIYVPDEFRFEQEMPFWRAHYIKPGGEGHVHIFPINTPHWRIVELELDPNDMETVLEIILHEPFVPDLPLYEMKTVDARNLHLNNIQAAKRDKVSINHKHPIFQPFYDNHGVTPERLDLYRKHVDAHRRGQLDKASVIATMNSAQQNMIDHRAQVDALRSNTVG